MTHSHQGVSEPQLSDTTGVTPDPPNDTTEMTSVLCTGSGKRVRVTWEKGVPPEEGKRKDFEGPAKPRACLPSCSGVSGHCVAEGRSAQLHPASLTLVESFAPSLPRCSRDRAQTPFERCPRSAIRPPAAAFAAVQPFSAGAGVAHLFLFF